MPTFTVPDSFGSFREFNPCHGAADGRFCTAGAWASMSRRVTKGRRATKGEMRPATDRERKRLGIPPAYTNVQIATDPRAELRATAVTAKGKTASYYSAAYTDRQTAAKWSRVTALNRTLPALSARIEKEIARPGGMRQTEAMTLHLILRTGLRNGEETESGARGASSLLMEDVTVSGDQVRLRFTGKGGVTQRHTVKSPAFAAYVQARQAAGATKVFPHDAADTLRYLRTISGNTFKVHDLRTWYATIYADQLTQKAVRAGLTPKTAREFKTLRKEIGTKVSKALGNTPAIALKTYIHPFVFRPLEQS